MYEDLVARLYHKIMEEPLRPKVLLTRSYAQGHQLLEQICKRYGAVYNVDVQTLRGLMIDRTKLELYRRKIQLLDEEQPFWVVRSIMKQLATGQTLRYINEEMLKPGIVDRIHRAIIEMRLAAIRSDDIQARLFTNPDKGAPTFAGHLRELFAGSQSNRFCRFNRIFKA